MVHPAAVWAVRGNAGTSGRVLRRLSPRGRRPARHRLATRTGDGRLWRAARCRHPARHRRADAGQRPAWPANAAGDLCIRRPVSGPQRADGGCCSDPRHMARAHPRHRLSQRPARGIGRPADGAGAAVAGGRCGGVACLVRTAGSDTWRRGRAGTAVDGAARGRRARRQNPARHRSHIRGGSGPRADRQRRRGRDRPGGPARPVRHLVFPHLGRTCTADGREP